MHFGKKDYEELEARKRRVLPLKLSASLPTPCENFQRFVTGIISNTFTRNRERVVNVNVDGDHVVGHESDGCYGGKLVVFRWI